MADLTRDEALSAAASFEALLAGVEELTEAMRESKRRTRRLSVGVVVAVLLVLCLAGFQFSNRQVIGAIEDCTQPTGQCYRDGQTRTGGAVKSLTDEMERVRRDVCASAEPVRRPADCPPPNH